jgi:hypothetical protein
VIFAAVLANFRMEGQDRMTGTVPDTVTLAWHIAPLAPPQPLRHCPGCGTTRPYRCSGKVRLNANGRRLDAWLIYRCSTCDRTWNLPLLDRITVAAIDPKDLWAMQVSDTAWVEARAFDLALLRRHVDRIEMPTDLTVTKDHLALADWCKIRLDLHAPQPTGQRLDRFLGREIGLSRSRLQAMVAGGGITFAPGSRQALKSPLVGSIRLRINADCLREGDKTLLSRALSRPDPPP